MAYWLFKVEPNHYPFDELIKDKKTRWDGVRNNLALRHLRSIRENDLVLYYHTAMEKAVVGIAKVVSAPYPDPKVKDPKIMVVDICPVKKLKNPVTLKEIKENAKFRNFELVRIPRLSIVPVPNTVWDDIIKMSQQNPR